MIDGRSDRELLAAHATGDQGAFRELVLRHRDRLWALALRMLGDREDAADALQEALLKAHRAAAAFRGDAAVSTWLHRVVLNCCLDRIRHDRSRPAASYDGEVLERVVGERGHAAPDPAEPTALRLDVEEALAALPAHQRAAVVLVDVLGHDVATAAELLGCPAGTVKSRCARGRARLAVLLGHLAPAPGNLDGAPGVAPGAGAAAPNEEVSTDGP